MKYRFFLAILFLLATSCGGYDHPNFPKVPVDFSLYPDDALVINLNYIGGHEYFTGGVNGVVVFRIDQWSFSAFDRACPHDWDHVDEPRVWVEEDGITLRCEKCKTLYNILDGSVITGVSKYPLKPYYTNYDGVKLRIYSGR